MQLVSVVVGTYNGSKYIETQLQSILDQSYSNIEIIIVDDASDDNTVEIIKAIASKHPQINFHAFKNNVGYIKNFERGIQLAKGDYISLSDQDDWWHPSKIETLITHLKTQDLVYCDSTFVNEQLKPTGQRFSSVKNLISSNNPIHFLIDNCVSGHALLFKKELFEKASPFPALIPHDWWLTYCATLNNGILYVDEALIKYRHHNDNVIASNTSKKSKSEKQLQRRDRLQQFANKAEEVNHKDKDIISKFNQSYKSFYLINNSNRVSLFFKHQDAILKILKKSKFKKIVFCLNMFFKLK